MMDGWEILIDGKEELLKTKSRRGGCLGYMDEKVDDICFTMVFIRVSFHTLFPSNQPYSQMFSLCLLV